MGFLDTPLGDLVFRPPIRLEPLPGVCKSDWPMCDRCFARGVTEPAVWMRDGKLLCDACLEDAL